ncbi:acyl-CoA dehydrogenase domain-containing protein [Marinicella sp. W31]|uniref:acyl-CoA dehydrogenase domain-containing protein n=1 Tax=Marinicella sp. W31 TaxID=3023713 RepID=UPI003757CE75
MLTIFWFVLPFILYLTEDISKAQGVVLLWLIIITIVVFNVKRVRRALITNRLVQLLNNKEPVEWQQFDRIDSGWLSTEFERSIFTGRPDFTPFPKTPACIKSSHFLALKEKLKDCLESNDKQSSDWLHLCKDVPIAALNIPTEYGGAGLDTIQCSQIIRLLSEHEPVLSAVVGIINFDSVSTLIQRFGTTHQKDKYLSAISQHQQLPFLNTTSLYELLENGKSSLEARVDIETDSNRQQHGIRVSFTDVIMLGTEQSGIFYVAVNVTDFANYLGDKTRLGTALCLLDTNTDKISIEKGNSAYSGYLHYFRCSAKDLFIPLDQIIGGFEAVDKGIEHLFQLQSKAASIWSTSVSLPIHEMTTLLSWHFSHLKKQNGRSLLSYRLVKKQLNQQLSHYLKLKLISQLGSHRTEQSMLSYSQILLKNSVLQATLDQLGILRTILGSHAHNLKTESNLGNFYKVMHLSMELDGDSHEINQLPLMKKVAMATHPYYAQEIALLANPNFDSKAFDKIFFKHIGFIWHNLSRIWAYAAKTSWTGRLLFRKNKHKDFIRRLSSSFAFVADMSLIKWSIKKQSNTEFTGYLAQCNQQLILLMSLINFYQQKTHTDAQKFIIKQSMKAAFFEAQVSLNAAINSAFGRIAALLLKIAIFPFGKPFNKASFLAKNNHQLQDMMLPESEPNQNTIVSQVSSASARLIEISSIENAVTNATGSAVTTKNFNVLIDRTLAAGIISVEQAENIREAYQSILDLQLINHFGKNHENQKHP